MNLLEKIYELSEITVTEPLPGGELHLSFVVLVVALSAVLCVTLRNCRDKTLRATVFVMWLVMLAFEVCKQLAVSLDTVDGEIIFSYDWGSFPFQLCSTPLYILPFLALLRDGKARDFCAAYIMTYGLLGGVAVYLFPDTVFDEHLFLNIQSMVHHGLQIVSGVLTAVWYRKKCGKGFFMKGHFVFVIMFTVAMLLNTVFYEFLLDSGRIDKDDTFNMFLISPYMDFDIPLFTDFFNSLSPWAMVCVYFLGVPVGASVLMSIAYKWNLKSEIKKEIRCIKKNAKRA